MLCAICSRQHSRVGCVAECEYCRGEAKKRIGVKLSVSRTVGRQNVVLEVGF